MDINFSDSDLVFMYGHFRKEANKIIKLKNTSGCPIHEDTLNVDINLYTSLADKLRDACPALGKMDKYL